MAPASPAQAYRFSVQLEFEPQMAFLLCFKRARPAVSFYLVMEASRT